MKRRPLSLIHWLVILHATVLVLSVFLLVRQEGELPSGRDRIVVVPIDGIISHERGSLGGGASVEDLVGLFEDLREDDSVRAVVLRINSPGGSVGAVQDLYSAVRKLGGAGKTVVSSFADISASGGYYLACAGDRIVAQPGTLTGSIGVIMEIPNVKGLLEKVGVSIETIRSGRMKDAGSPFRRMTDDERAYFQSVIMDSYKQFFAAVKDGRSLTDEQLSPLADGRIFSGQAALKNRLVDALGGLEEAIEIAKLETGLSDKNPIIEYHRKEHPLDRLLSFMESRSPVRELTETRFGARLLYVMP